MHVVFEPVELLEQLAVLVPRPRRINFVAPGTYRRSVTRPASEPRKASKSCFSLGDKCNGRSLVSRPGFFCPPRS